MVAETKTPIVSLVTLLGQPTPAGLWRLRGDLLQRGVSPEDAIWSALDRFYHFLSELVATSTAREYSHFASLLDIGAVGGVALQNLLVQERGSEFWKRALVGGLSESLMVMAARQYVKAWEGELAALYRSAAWDLYQMIWKLSLALRPEMSADSRRAHLDSLLMPLQDENTGGTVKAILVARLYQILLLTYLGELLPAQEPS